MSKAETELPRYKQIWKRTSFQESPAPAEDSKLEVNNLNNLNSHDRKHAVVDDAQFEMDI